MKYMRPFASIVIIVVSLAILFMVMNDPDFAQKVANFIYFMVR